MAVIQVDVDTPDPWHGGLAGLVVYTATAAVFVEGLDEPICGDLVRLPNDQLMVEACDGDDASAGSITVLPVARIIAGRARWKVADRGA